MGIYDHLWVLGGSRYTEPIWTWAWHGCTNAYFWEWPSHQSSLAPHCGHHQHPRMCPTVSKRFLIWCGKEMCPAMISNRFQHDLEAHGMSHPFIDRCLTSDQRIKTSGKLPMSRGHGKYQPSQDHIVEVEMTGRWQRRRQPRTPSRPESTRVDQSRPESRVMTKSFPEAV